MSILLRFLLGYFSISVVLATILILTIKKLDTLIEENKVNWISALYLVEIKFAFFKTNTKKRLFVILALLLTLPIMLVIATLKVLKDFLIK